eukprot:UN10291
MDLRYPRILLPSIEVLQRDSSPHPIFDKLTMAQIFHCTNTEEYKNAMIDGGLFNTPQVTTPRQQRDFATYTSNKQNHHFISTKRHEQLSLQQQQQQNNTNTPLSSGTEILMMLSPSTLQQTLNTNTF